MTPSGVLHVLFSALRDSKSPDINDVVKDKGVDGQEQLVLTTEDEKGEKQVWILDEQSILEHDADYVEPTVPLHFHEISKPGYGVLLLTRNEITDEYYLPDPNTEGIDFNNFNIVNEDGLLLESYVHGDEAITAYKKRLDATHD